MKRIKSINLNISLTMKKTNSKTTIKTFVTLILLCFYGYHNNVMGQYAVIVNFTGLSGAYSGGTPQTDQNVISDGTYIYGMTNGGGTSGLGVIYKVMPDGTNYSVLMDFTGALNGSKPEGSFIYDGTYLYGMTSTGGTSNLGTLFKIKTDGTGYVKLKDFTGTLNGSTPKGSLIYDGTFLYGITSLGGAWGQGDIFKIKPDGTGYTNLYGFNTSIGLGLKGSLCSDGTYLYGMTNSGGLNNKGILFKVMPDGTGFSTLLNFNGALNGANPLGSLTFDGTYLYGMTENGGSSDYGVVFKILPNGTGYVKLNDFTGVVNGRNPKGSLIFNGTILYGMTRSGGSSNSGTIFNITTSGTYTKLWDFTGAAGGFPTGSLNLISGNLYGMTTSGGPIGAANGTIFKYQLLATNLNENNFIDSFFISPNPSNGQMTIEKPENMESCQLSVHNLMGELMYSEIIKERLTSINLNLKTGLYIVSLYNKGQKTTRKIIVE